MAGEEKEFQFEEVTENKFAAVIFVTVFLIIVAVFYIIYIYGSSTFTLDIIIIVLGVVLGIIGAIHFLTTVTEEEETIKLEKGESIILSTKEGKKRCYLSFPKEEGGFLGEDAPLECDLHLTTHGIIAEPPDTGVNLIYIPLFRISSMKMEEKLNRKYIRMKYYSDEKHLDELLIFLGVESEPWYNAILEMIEE